MKGQRPPFSGRLHPEDTNVFIFRMTFFCCRPFCFFFFSSPSKHTENTGASERTATPRWLCPCAFRAAERCDPAMRWPFAQEGLEETRRSGRSLIPVAPVLLCTARRTLRNPSACRLYGQLARKHSKKPLWALQSPQRWAAFSG